MRLFKFMFYGFGFFIGLTIAFCANTNDNNYSYQDSSKVSSINTLLSSNEEKTDTYKVGKKLFKSNCAACHNKNMIDDMTGPALAGTSERWAGREELLYQWIRNSQALIASGDPYAVGLYNQYNKSVMTAFPNLKDEEITALLEYIEAVGG